MYSEYRNHDFAVYGGYLTDDGKILQSTSGGIATALSEYMLQQGGCVAGVAYNGDFTKAEYVIVDNMDDVQKLKGSKYIDCDKKTIYADVKKRIDAGQKVLFIGLPCIVGALYSYLGTRPENLLTCELICHGPTYAKVHSDYIAFLEKKYKSKVVAFTARHKKGAWTPGYLYAKFESGQVFQKPFNNTQYGYAFSVLSKKSCYDCKFKGNNRQADIMVGDFWGATEADVFWNKNGVSSIFAETEKGDAFLQKTPGITLFPTTFDRVVEKNPMVIRSRNQGKNAEKFAKLLSENGLIYAVKHVDGWEGSAKRALKRFSPRRVLAAVKARLRA